MKKGNTKITAGMLIFTSLYLLVFPVLILFLSGDWLWLEGWIFSIWLLVLCETIIIFLYRNDPELLAERYKRPGTGNQKGWDKYVVYALVVLFLLWIIIIPVDAKRFGWSPLFPLWLKILGVAVLLLSSFLFFRSYKDNTYLSPLVRIQTERKQRVVSSGVYGFVRHPMYLGGILLFIGAPALLGSIWGFILGAAVTFLIVLRIILEEKTLVAELEGYSEYQKKVRFRLVPFIW
jgi:protein-S-isoprenylcysteine O-methyltransferase Ste14